MGSAGHALQSASAAACREPPHSCHLPGAIPLPGSISGQGQLARAVLGVPGHRDL